jgi:hypothetical protein
MLRRNKKLAWRKSGMEVNAVKTMVATEVKAAATEVQVVQNIEESVLGQRAKELHSVLGEGTQSRTTTAVGAATTAEGESVTLVGFSEDNLRTQQRAALKPGEIAVSGKGHAETTILNYAEKNNIKVHAVGASRPPASPLKNPVNFVIKDNVIVKPKINLPPK